jgi:LysM repeat protein
MKTRSGSKLILVAGLLGLSIALLAYSVFNSPSASAQIYYLTPTAEANGAIYYTVKQNDTCDTIALLNNIPVETLRNLNNLGLDQCRFLQIGQKLLLGTVPTQVITPGPSPTPTSNVPTPQPEQSYGTICVYLYDDVNGNAMAEPSETTNTGLLGGKVSIVNQEGLYTNVGTTLNTGEATCFSEIPTGMYTISMAIPDGFNPTSAQNYTIELKAGDTSTINFSAQLSARSSGHSSTAGSGKSVLLAVVGGIILLAGVGIGLYARYILKAR